MKKSRLIVVLFFLLFVVFIGIELFLIIKNGKGIFLISRSYITPEARARTAGFSFIFNSNLFFDKTDDISNHGQFELISKNTKKDIVIYKFLKYDYLYVLYSPSQQININTHKNTVIFVIINTNIQLKNLQKNDNWILFCTSGEFEECKSKEIPMPGDILTKDKKLINTWSKEDINLVLSLLPSKEKY